MERMRGMRVEEKKENGSSPPDSGSERGGRGWRWRRGVGHPFFLLVMTPLAHCGAPGQSARRPGKTPSVAPSGAPLSGHGAPEGLGTRFETGPSWTASGLSCACPSCSSLSFLRRMWRNSQLSPFLPCYRRLPSSFGGLSFCSLHFLSSIGPPLFRYPLLFPRSVPQSPSTVGWEFSWGTSLVSELLYAFPPPKLCQSVLSVQSC